MDNTKTVQGKYVLEWSPRQQCFHHCEINDAIEENLSTFWDTVGNNRQYAPGYIIIGFLKTSDERAKVTKKLKEYRSQIIASDREKKRGIAVLRWASDFRDELIETFRFEAEIAEMINPKNPRKDER